MIDGLFGGNGKYPTRMEGRDFSATERKELPFLLPEAADATELLLARGLEAAQNEVHPRS